MVPPYIVPLCDCGPWLWLCCSCHQEVECIFPHFWFMPALWLFSTDTAREVMFWDFWNQNLRGFLLLLLLRKFTVTMYKSPGYHAVETSQVEREVLWNKKPSGKGGLVKENKSSRYISPGNTKERGTPAVLASPRHFGSTQLWWQTRVKSSWIVQP